MPSNGKGPPAPRVALAFLGNTPGPNPSRQSAKAELANLLRITGTVEKGQSLCNILKRYGFGPQFKW